MTPIEQANQTIARVREKTDSCIVFCSFGKDSMVILDMCAKRFTHVVAVFMYFVKNLEHIDRYFRWCKAKYPNVEWEYVPHWTLSYLLRSGMYCTAQPKIKLIKLADVVKTVRIKHGIDYVCLGMKSADGMNRRIMLGTYKDDAYIHKDMFYPLATWKQNDVLAYMKHHRLPAPVRYTLQASSGMGFDEQCFLWLEKNCPQDLEKIYEVFPLSERILWEAHKREQQE